MSGICWDFPLLATGNQSGNNIAGITMFQGSSVMDALAREVCQNSLDAKRKDIDNETPVKMKFQLYTLEKSKYDMFSEYETNVDNCIDFWENSKLRTEEMMSFVNSVKKSLEQENIPVLVMSDYNTTGLTGIDPDGENESFWDLLVNTEGISIKGDKGSAGSYGIGKNAPFAYSALNLIFYNTLAIDGGRAFEGVARLATTHKFHLNSDKKRKTQPVGKYLYLIDELTGRPILPQDNCPLANHECFLREKGNEGTDVAIFGFKVEEYLNWEKDLSISIIKNFILALYNGKIDITIKSDRTEYNLNKNTLKDLLFTEFKDNLELKYTRQIYKTITEPDVTKTVKIAEDGDLTIRVKYSDTYSQSLSRFRTTGMLINTTTNDVYPHFSVIVSVNNVGNEILGETLKNAEPPQHTEWKSTYVKDLNMRKKALAYLKAISKKIKDVLDECDPIDDSKTIDSGIGNYLPDTASESGTTSSGDGLSTSVQVQSIIRKNGDVVYDKEALEGGAAIGTKVISKAHKTGKKKRKKRVLKKLTVVKPDSTGKTKGIAIGTSGKLRIIIPKINERRVFRLAASSYRLYIDSSKEYENVYVKFNATKDDATTDETALEIGSAKMNGITIPISQNNRLGPFKLSQGDNVINFIFSNKETMAVIPEILCEVRS